MTRKDYELIAEALRIASGSITVAPYDAKTAIELVAHLLADRLEKQNPRFDRARFITASSINETRFIDSVDGVQSLYYEGSALRK